jgi:hypothetical protein
LHNPGMWRFVKGVTDRPTLNLGFLADSRV